MTAQETLDKWLKGWKKRQYNVMYSFSQKTWKAKHTRGELKSMFPIQIDDYEIDREVESVEGVTDIVVIVKYRGEWKTLQFVRLVRETEPYVIKENGEWGVNPISAKKLTL
jgi:hypothetical protein